MKKYLFSLLAGVLLSNVFVGDSNADSDGGETNIAAIDQLITEMKSNYVDYNERKDDGLPFTLESKDEDGEIRASVRTYFPGIEFNQFAARLSDVSQWCEFIPLHLNIKACGYSEDSSDLRLGFYVGAKGYTAPDEAQLLVFRVEVDEYKNFLEIGFAASKGPFGSSNYLFDFRAVEIDQGVYLEFDLSSRPGFISSLAKVYFATVGSGKVGFSTMGKDRSGRVRYVKGQRGGAERNIVRYLLSMKSYFETIEWEHESDIYERRLDYWFDLTEQHKKQLNEMDREAYMNIKLRERNNQLLLIDSIKNNFVPDFSTDTTSQ